MTIIRIQDIIEQQDQLNRRYSEFLRVEEMSAGVYRLPVGAQDLQHPHSEEEMYYVIHGQATIQIGEKSHEVAAGACIYVPANVPHWFSNITKDLVLLVVFAPAEGARTG